MEFRKKLLVDASASELVIAVDELLNELEKVSPIQRSVVEVKFFLGLTDQEGALLSISPSILFRGSGPEPAAGYSTDSQGNHDKQPRTRRSVYAVAGGCTPEATVRAGGLLADCLRRR